MSLDNVIAVAGAAHGDLVLVVFGIALSIPLVVWGSGLLARLMNRYPWIVWLGGGILAEVAVDMMVHDKWVHEWLGGIADLISGPLRIGFLVVFTGLGWWLSQRRERASV
jgi:predicted tellurium resistance membrane protein TerC